jgi:cytochrome c
VKAANPCAAKNPCTAKNPCAASDRIDPKVVTRPAGTRLFAGASVQLVKEGKRLWNDRSLGTSGLACGTCHLNHANFNPSFVKPFPHAGAMTEQRAGLKQVSLDEMVQFCMVVPMASKPLAWDSKELAALTAYAGEVQKGFIKAAAANPCMLKPSAANPCNPCAAKNPCAGKR